MPAILVVDDSPIDLLLASDLLKQGGDWEIATAADGQAALDLLNERRFDVVVTDIQMPRMDGFQLVSAVRRSAPHVPVILMTAVGSEETAVKALASGAASYVAKKRLARDLAETVRRALEANRERAVELGVLRRMTHAGFALENDAGVLFEAAAHVRRLFADATGARPPTTLQFGTAVEEALLNALHHGNLELDPELRLADYDLYRRLAERRSASPPYCDRRIRLELRIDPEATTVVVRDEGRGFDPALLPEPGDAQSLARPCGRGVMLMRTFMDELRFEDGGRCVVLVRGRADRPTVAPADPVDPAESGTGLDEWGPLSPSTV